MKIGLLIPHFPSQTGAFFWREVLALEGLGVQIGLASTRRPPAGEVCHTWSREAMERTTYLYPPPPGLAARAIGLIVSRRREAWRAWRALWSAGGGSIGRLARKVPLLLLGAELAVVARREGWAHLHAHSAADAAYITMVAGMLARIPYSITLHGRLSTYGDGQAEKWRHAAFGIAVNPQLKAEILAAAPGVAEERIAVAAMGVDVERFARSVPYVPPMGDRWRLTSVGRLHLGKGHQDAIRAMALLRDRGVDASLIIMGDGPAREDLEALVAELDLADRVVFLGAVSEDRIRAEHEKAHAFVLASHEEAVGVAAMEAMAMELPVIAAAVGGLQDLVRDGIDGVLVPKESPERLAGAIASLLRDPEGCVRMGMSGRRRIEESYTSEREARVLKGMVEGVFGAMP